MVSVAPPAAAAPLSVIVPMLNGTGASWTTVNPDASTRRCAGHSRRLLESSHVNHPRRPKAWQSAPATLHADAGGRCVRRKYPLVIVNGLCGFEVMPAGIPHNV